MEYDYLHSLYISLWFLLGPEKRPDGSTNETVLMFRAWLLVAGDRTMNYVRAQQ